MSFSLTAEAIEPAVLRTGLLDPSAGAYCSYEGWVRNRNEGKPVTLLRYSSYPELAPSIAETILDEAKDRFAMIDCALVHRTGDLRVGEAAVWVGVTSPHRDNAFLACRYIIDNVKDRLPVWKKEFYHDGSSAWIENHQCDCADPANRTGHHSTHAHGNQEDLSFQRT